MKENAAISVMRKLKDDIITGKLYPAQKLVIAKLKDRYGVGVGPLREALSLLVGDELVKVEDQRGYRVSGISIDDMCDIYQTRARVESLCLQLSIENGDDDWEGRILGQSHSLFKLKDVSQKNGELDIDEWDRRHDIFHSELVSNCGLNNLLNLRQTLRDKALRYKHIWLKKNISSDYLFKENFIEHQELVDLALKRKDKIACELIYKHLNIPVDIIKDILK